MAKPIAAPELALKINYGQLLSIGLPLIGGILFQAVVAIIEIRYVSFVGADQYAALTVTSLFYLITMMMALSLSQGAQILIARSAGRGHVRAIGSLVDHTLVIALVAATVLFLITRFGSLWFMDVLIQDENVYRLSVDYLAYRAWGIPFSFLTLALAGFYVGIGRTVPFIWSAAVMVVANVGLHDVLVLGRFGVASMGLDGSALAGMLSEVAAFLVLFGHALIKRHPARFGFLRFKNMSWSVTKSIAALSGPIALQQMTGSTSWFLFFVLVENELGTPALNASNILRVAYLVISVPARALGGAAETVVSNVIGQGRSESVWVVTRRTAILSFAFTAMLTGIIWAMANTLFLEIAPMPGVGVTKADEVALATRALPSLFIALSLLSVGGVCFRAVTGTGAVKTALGFEVVAVLVYLAYAYVVVKWLSADLAVAWTAEIVYLATLLVLSTGFLLRGRWPSLPHHQPNP
jgi:Na+-driven multidrug efflux pump